MLLVKPETDDLISLQKPSQLGWYKMT